MMLLVREATEGYCQRFELFGFLLHLKIIIWGQSCVTVVGYLPCLGQTQDRSQFYSWHPPTLPWSPSLPRAISKLRARSHP